MAKRLLKHGGAKCPNCQCTYRWFWDWESDSYVNQFGDSALTKDLEFNEVQGLGDESVLLQEDKHLTISTCLCLDHVVLDVMVVDEMGGFNYNHPDWLAVNWEQDEYSWFGPKGPPE